MYEITGLGGFFNITKIREAGSSVEGGILRDGLARSACDPQAQTGLCFSHCRGRVRWPMALSSLQSALLWLWEGKSCTLRLECFENTTWVRRRHHGVCESCVRSRTFGWRMDSHCESPVQSTHPRLAGDPGCEVWPGRPGRAMLPRRVSIINLQVQY